MPPIPLSEGKRRHVGLFRGSLRSVLRTAIACNGSTSHPPTAALTIPHAQAGEKVAEGQTAKRAEAKRSLLARGVCRYAADMRPNN